ncbi:hypothetical protein [Pelagimonas varians]|uniref:Uncharacterized protein n=1 Tax=Pelagimonas varians TaxID=696760 RepID=A0A238JZ45_9RHOB|nr:hypothetical protein [Pelagimonas varians]PYG33135.1 hypothetical protein C8N36_102130 [Pelagimonas varians]SMX35783.1 hypothetical protein PEV8663_00592 [Pelagimonas varians]
MAFKGLISALAGVPTLLAGPVSGQVYFQNQSGYSILVTATAAPETPSISECSSGWRYAPGSVESLDINTLMPGVPEAQYLWALSDLGAKISVQHGDIENG